MTMILACPSLMPNYSSQSEHHLLLTVRAMLQVDVSCQAVSLQLPADASLWQDGAVHEGLILEAGRCMLGCHFNITWVGP